MNLAELLEYTAKQFLDDRVDLVDGDPDELWTDAYLIRQLNQAQRILARRAWVIVERGVAPAGIIILTTGKTLYPLHTSILRVIDATPTTQLTPLGRANNINLINPYPPSSDAFDIGVAASLAGVTLNTPGAPLAISTDSGWRTMRVAPPPAAAQNGVKLELTVVRLPINLLTEGENAGCPEVPEDYHMDLCEYAAGKALTLPNVDSGNKADGKALLASFDDVCAEARRDRQRGWINDSRWSFASSTAVIR